MHPILSHRHSLMWYAIAWLLAGLVMAKLLVVAELSAWSNALYFAIPASIVYGFIVSSAYYVCRSLPFSRRNFYSVMALFGSASVLSGFAWLALCQSWNSLLRLLSADHVAVDMPPNLMIVLLVAGVALYGISLMAHDVFIVINNVRIAERKEAQASVLARDAQLQVLRSQINPHFLFNSLNSISALTSIDSAAARAMTISLAHFFRQTLALSEKQTIPLSDEITLCEHFLAVEKIRFGKKLESAFSISEEAQSAHIPPMILQPLLENAIKHGIRDLIDGGVIHVRAHTSDQRLYLSIENPIDDNPTPSPSSGTGLENIRRRLASLYDDKARITCSREATKFSVNMVMPLALRNEEIDA